MPRRGRQAHEARELAVRDGPPGQRERRGSGTRRPWHEPHGCAEIRREFRKLGTQEPAAAESGGLAGLADDGRPRRGRGSEWIFRLGEGKPGARIALVGANIADARSIMVEGTSGLLK